MLKAIRKTPLPVLVLILGVICPSELSLFIGTVRMPPHRVAILIFFIPALIKLLSGRKLKMASYDVMFLLYNLWTIGIFMYHMGPGDGLQFGGSLVVESLGGYLIARAYVRDYETFEATVGSLILSVFIVGLLALPEAITSTHFIHDWMRNLTGIAQDNNDEVRLGLSRAYATFDHPILYGSYCASMLALALFTGESVGQRSWRCGVIGGATFLGLSSAPINAMLVQLVLGGVHLVTRKVAHRVKMIAALVFGLYLGLGTVSNQSPIEFIVMRITLDPWTAYHRILIWTYGMQNVWANPFLGLGLGDWVRPRWMHSASVDAFWLLIPMRAGFPAIILLVAAIWLLIARVHKRGPRQRSKLVQRAAVGWTIAFIGITLAGLTVHFWNSAHSYVFFLLGLGGWWADPVKAVKAAAAGKARQRPARPARRPAWAEPEQPGLAAATPFEEAPPTLEAGRRAYPRQANPASIG